MCLFVYVPVWQYGHICMQLFMEAQESVDFSWSWSFGKWNPLEEGAGIWTSVTPIEL